MKLLKIVLGSLAALFAVVQFVYGVGSLMQAHAATTVGARSLAITVFCVCLGAAIAVTLFQSAFPHHIDDRPRARLHLDEYDDDRLGWRRGLDEEDVHETQNRPRKEERLLAEEEEPDDYDTRLRKKRRRRDDD